MRLVIEVAVVLTLGICAVLTARRTKRRCRDWARNTKPWAEEYRQDDMEAAVVARVFQTGKACLAHRNADGSFEIKELED